MDFDYDLFVIGGGSGGVRAARFAADYGARVGLAESRYLGGTCVNVGCVPKKLMVYSAHFSEDFELAASFGWQQSKAQFNWNTLISNKDAEISRLNGIYRQLLEGSKVEIFDAHAKLLDKHTLAVGERTIRAKNILIASGGWPHIPDFPGSKYAIGSNEVFFLDQLPGRVLVVGGGYISVEFASIFHGLGAKVTQLYRGELFLRGFDSGVREHLRDEMRNKGIDLRFNADLAQIEKQADGTLKATLKDGQIQEFDCVFYATGRRPMLEDLGLENTAVELDARGFIAVDDLFQTSEDNISALGDVIGRVQLTPVALAEGMALARKLFKPDEYRPVDYRLIPTAVFSLPNIGTVGMSEEDARKAGHRLQIFESRFRPMKMSLSPLQERTFMKLVVDADNDRVLGAHMVGPEAGEMIQGIAVALKAGATKAIFDDTIGIHPTSAEEWVTMRKATRSD